MLNVTLSDWAATERLGATLAAHLQAGDRVFLRGELGSGKTALAGVILAALGYQGTVKSPTYTLIEEYDLSFVRVIHADLYRLQSARELETLGWWDYEDGRTIFLVEWPERAGGLLQADVDVSLALTDDVRQAQVYGLTRRGIEVVDRLRP